MEEAVTGTSRSIEEAFAPRTVGVEDVCKALSAMWRTNDEAEPETTDGQADGGGTVIRSRALTMFAIATDAEEFSTMANAVNAAVSIVPARSVLVELHAKVDGVAAEV